MSAPIPCQWCRSQFTPDTVIWMVCKDCGYRVCTACTASHKGPHTGGGNKCSQCAHGWLEGPKAVR